MNAALRAYVRMHDNLKIDYRGTLVDASQFGNLSNFEALAAPGLSGKRAWVFASVRERNHSVHSKWILILPYCPYRKFKRFDEWRVRAICSLSTIWRYSLRSPSVRRVVRGTLAGRAGKEYRFCHEKRRTP